MSTNSSDKLRQAIELLSATPGMSDVEKVRLEGLLGEVEVSLESEDHPRCSRVGVCPHCGDITEHILRHTYRRWEEDLVLLCNHTVAADEDIESLLNHHRKQYRGYCSYFVACCDKCTELLLYVNANCSDDILDCFDNPDVTRLLWPQSNALHDAVPADVRSCFTDALGTKDCSLALTAIRRAIEAICNDKGCRGKTLKDRLDSLNICGMSPQDSMRLTDGLRRLTNRGAHLDKEVPTQSDVHRARGLFDLLVQQIYIVPYQVNVLAVDADEPQPHSDESGSMVQ
jgi:hypothetical protein